MFQEFDGRREDLVRRGQEDGLHRVFKPIYLGRWAKKFAQQIDP